MVFLISTIPHQPFQVEMVWGFSASSIKHSRKQKIIHYIQYCHQFPPSNMTTPSNISRFVDREEIELWNQKLKDVLLQSAFNCFGSSLGVCCSPWQGGPYLYTGSESMNNRLHRVMLFCLSPVQRTHILQINQWKILISSFKSF